MINPLRQNSGKIRACEKGMVFNMYRIIFFTRKGMIVAQCIKRYYQELGEQALLIAGSDKWIDKNEEIPAQIFMPETTIKQYVASYFNKEKTCCFIFVGATGIAVRMVSEVIQNKWVDPAVLVVDELGKYVIPLLSGHTGGANAYARELASKMQAEAVITTASDLEELPSFDVWAREQNLILMNRKQFVNLASLHIENKSIGILLEDGWAKESFALHSYFKDCGWVKVFTMDQRRDWEAAFCKVFVGMDNPKALHSDFWFCPRKLILGIGCRKNCKLETIMQTLDEALLAAGFQENGKWCIAQIHSIDLKESEPGLLELSKNLGIPFVCHSAEELKKVQGVQSESAFVKEITGLDCVCERAALQGAATSKLLLGKYGKDGVTIAFAVKDRVAI